MFLKQKGFCCTWTHSQNVTIYLKGDNPQELSLPWSLIDLMKWTLLPHQVRQTLCSVPRRALRLYILSRVLPQQVTPWSHASSIWAIHSTSQHMPTPLKSSQTSPLQITLHHQDFPSTLTLRSAHTLETSLYPPASPGASSQRTKIQTLPHVTNSQVHLHNKLLSTKQ